jgi:hypothetical protein
MLYNGQSLLSITLDTGIDLSTATELFILYRKPDGTKGQWTATQFETTKVDHALNEAEKIDLIGLWKFQAYVKIGALEGYGDIVSYDFKPNIK